MATTLNFDIFETNNPKTLGIMDSSLYDNNIPIASPIISILLPGYIEPVHLYYQPNKVNIYNSNNLGLTSVSDPSDFSELPDGIYTINYSFVPRETYFIEKKIFRTMQLQKGFEKALLKYGSECSTKKDQLNKLLEIEFYMYGVIANANVCEYNKAIQLYAQASKELDQFLKRC